ncbi:MAG TPA: preprotein translocase subunit SecA [Thermoanaerobaculia bacterium]
MIGALARKFFGSANDRRIKGYQSRVDAINALEGEVAALSDEALRARTAEFKKQLAEGKSLDDILVPAFATVREAAKRTLGQRHFDVQLVGGMVLHEGKIAEMKTGEGKTLVATLPVYLNALTGRGVHVVTVNDYLARRDSEWMGRIYKFLGLTVGVIQNPHGDRERQAAYRCDVTYGTNNEFGFDYLRDNMKFDLEAMVQRDPVYAIVDEVDSILIDEARTPLIISGPSEESTEKYYTAARIVPKLIKDTDYQIDEKQHTAVLTEEGVLHAEKLLGGIELYDPQNIDLLHAVTQAVRAASLYRNDVEYVVKDGEVLIVDEFTGRLMPGRRWSDGLHQAVEAKEGVRIESENQTLATITFQNLFRMYEKLAGMTGTADTEAAEFDKIYKLEVVVIPPNRIMQRRDQPDLVYRTEREKFDAIVQEIKEKQKLGQPSLVGTISIEKSEALSSALKKSGVPHVVLNAKHHERESEIVAQAGRKGAVTIATNMAGRGTDILLGGNPEFLAAQKTREVEDASERKRIEEEIKADWKGDHEEVVRLGGLHIVGTERHESRRIDNQLRGRSGRQGDPGSSRFYLSLEDDLMRIFGGDRIMGIMECLGMEEGVPIEHGMVTRAIERAQKQVEGRNFEARKHLLEYDDVMNKQRESIYTLRRSILDGREGREYILNSADEIVAYLVDTHYPEGDREVPDEAELNAELYDYFGLDLRTADVDLQADRREDVKYKITEAVNRRYEEKENLIGADNMRLNEKYLLLQVIDQQWKDHLLNIDHLKEGIGLRGYGQRDPLIEYKRESFEMFQSMMERIQDRVVKILWKIELAGGSGSTSQGEREESQRVSRALPPQPPKQQMTFSGAPKEAPAPVKRAAGKVGRNDPCPCGSGKKYKKCHGTDAA